MKVPYTPEEELAIAEGVVGRLVLRALQRLAGDETEPQTEVTLDDDRPNSESDRINKTEAQQLIQNALGKAGKKRLGTAAKRRFFNHPAWPKPITDNQNPNPSLRRQQWNRAEVEAAIRQIAQEGAE